MLHLTTHFPQIDFLDKKNIFIKMPLKNLPSLCSFIYQTRGYREDRAIENKK